MRGWWKAALAASALLALGAAAFAGAAWLGERKLERKVYVRVVPVAFASGPEAFRRGRYLFESRGCAQCHGPDGAGRVIVDEPGGFYVRSPNITRGPGGVVADYTEADWVRSIRHGVDPHSRPLAFMPSEDYNRLDDADFAALVAYVRSLPPVAGDGAVMRFTPSLKVLYGLGVIRNAAEKIDHARPPPSPVTPAANAEYGRYVAQMCVGCHRGDFAGGTIAGAPPHWPPAPNLTPVADSAMAPYDTAEKFAAMLRSGRRPDGTPVNALMPFESLKALDDTDVGALYAYLRSLPPSDGSPRGPNSGAHSAVTAVPS